MTAPDPAYSGRLRLLIVADETADSLKWRQVLEAQQFDIEVSPAFGSVPPSGTYAACLVAGERNLEDAASRMLSTQVDATAPALAIVPVLWRRRREELLAAGFVDAMTADADLFELAARVRSLLLRQESIRTLIIEDDARIAAELRLLLNATGHSCQIAADMGEARRLLASGRTDLLIIDRGLPDGDGLTLLAQSRAQGMLTPALILTARNHPRERVEGLKLGADDYIGKPFDEEEFLARIEVLLRPGRRDGRLTCGPLEIIRNDGAARWRGKRIDLAPRDFRLLAYLVDRPSLDIPTSMLRADVWEMERQHTVTNVVATGIKRLRQALKAAGLPEPQDLISTAPNGYRFNPERLLEIGDAD